MSSIYEDCPYHCRKGKIFMEKLGTYVDCPHCKGVVTRVEHSEETKEKAIELVDALQIPQAYQKAVYSRKTFLSAVNKRYFAVESLETILYKLDSIVSALSEGEVLNESLYFRMGNQVDYLTFVFYALRLAAENGVGTLPYISLTQLRSLQDSNVKVKSVLDVSYFDYTVTPFVILMATANTTADGWTALADILAERESHGLPTIVMGYWDVATLATRRVGADYLINNTSNRLGMLHPVEIKTIAQWEKESNLALKRTEVLEAVGSLKPEIEMGITSKNLFSLGD